MVNKKPLQKEHKDHELQGEYKGFRELHIKNDWLLIYYIDDTELILYLTITGSHSDNFLKIAL